MASGTRSGASPGGARRSSRAFGDVPVAYVADGHHRTASAAASAANAREANPQHTGNEDYNWFLCVLFPASQLQILPYNRAVKDLNGHSQEAFLDAVGSSFQVTARRLAEAAEAPATSACISTAMV